MHLYTPNAQLAAMQNVARHLKAGGQFAFDLSVPRYGAQATMRHEGESFTVAGVRHDVFLVQRLDEVRQRVVTEYYVDSVGPDRVLRRDFFTLEQRYYTRYEVEWLLRCAGLESPRVQGSFQGGPLQEGSDTMVFLTRRAASQPAPIEPGL